MHIAFFFIGLHLRKQAEKGAKRREFSYQIVRKTMKGKGRLKVVTKTEFSLSLSMFCIVQSSSKKCNFASKKQWKKKNSSCFSTSREVRRTKTEKVPSWDASVQDALWYSSVANARVLLVCGTVAKTDCWARVPKPYR